MILMNTYERRCLVEEWLTNLISLKGEHTVTLVAKTRPQLKKNPFGPVEKRARIRGVINKPHDSTQGRKFGERVQESCIIQDGTGDLFLEITVDDVEDVQYISIEDDQRIPDDSIGKYLYARKEDHAAIRTYRLSNVSEIWVDGSRIL